MWPFTQIKVLIIYLAWGLALVPREVRAQKWHNVTPAPNVCNDNSWRVYGGMCYKIYQGEMTWKEATKVCKAGGSQLATSTSSDINSKLSDFVYSSPNSPDSLKMWLYGRADANRQWTWRDTGSQILETSWNWASNQPDNAFGRENCLALDGFPLVQNWHDERCSLTLGVLCQASANNIPSTASTSAIKTTGPTSHQSEEATTTNSNVSTRCQWEKNNLRASQAVSEWLPLLVVLFIAPAASVLTVLNVLWVTTWSQDNSGGGIANIRRRKSMGEHSNGETRPDQHQEKTEGGSKMYDLLMSTMAAKSSKGHSSVHTSLTSGISGKTGMSGKTGKSGTTRMSGKTTDSSGSTDPRGSSSTSRTTGVSK